MHKILAKIARLAVSKAAAFCYAVAVGVAGNYAVNFVQQRNSPPATVTAPATQPGSGAAPAAPGPAAAVSRETAPATVPAPTQVALPVAPERPMAPRPAMTAAPLPEPPTGLALPASTALPVPVLKPTALPAQVHPAAISASPNRAATTAIAIEAAHGNAGIAARANPAPPPLNSVSASPAVSAEASAVASLPPLGPPIEVALQPATPSDATVKPATTGRQIEVAIPRRPTDAKPPPVAAAPANHSDSARSWELSDIWHPARAVEKGLHWAGEQVPAIGRDAGAKQPPATGTAGPIPLWPRATTNPSPSATPDRASAPQDKPGPGSGGLY